MENDLSKDAKISSFTNQRWNSFIQEPSHFVGSAAPRYVFLLWSFSLLVFFWLSKQKGNLTHSCTHSFLTTRPWPTTLSISLSYCSRVQSPAIGWCSRVTAVVPTQMVGGWVQGGLEGTVNSLRTKCARHIWPWETQPGRSETSRFKTKAPGLESQFPEAQHTEKAGPSRPLLPHSWTPPKINKAALLTLQYHKRGLCSLPVCRAKAGEKQAGSRGKDASLKFELWGDNGRPKLNTWTRAESCPSKFCRWYRNCCRAKLGNAWMANNGYLKQISKSHARGLKPKAHFQFIWQLGYTFICRHRFESIPLCLIFQSCFPETLANTKSIICKMLSFKENAEGLD